MPSEAAGDEDRIMGPREKLVYMANQIAAFFASMPHDEAVAGVAKHLNDFWEPRMRRAFFEIVEAGGPGLSPLVVEAAAKVRRPRPADQGDRPSREGPLQNSQ